MTLVDSSVWIDYFRGTSTRQTDELDFLLGTEPIAIGDLVLTEVLQGFVRDKDFIAAKKMLLSLHVVELGGRDIAIQAASFPFALQRPGLRSFRAPPWSDSRRYALTRVYAFVAFGASDAT